MKIDNSNNFSKIHDAKSNQCIPFSQDCLCWDMPLRLQKVYNKYGGLCDLICNKILIDDLLGKKGVDNDFLKNKITRASLNTDTIVGSHILKVYNVFQKMIAFIFKIYPDNIFSIRQQWKLITKKNIFNEDVLFSGIDKIQAGTILKMEVIQREFFQLRGHSLLIKKIDQEQFIYFDPNEGETRGLNKKELLQKINKQIWRWHASDIFLTPGETFLNRLRNKGILSK